MQGGSAWALDNVNYDIQITNKFNLHMECSHCENLTFNRQTAQENVECLGEWGQLLQV